MKPEDIKARMADFRTKRIGHTIAKSIREDILTKLIASDKEHVLAVVGPSGVGKSAVVERVLERLISMHEPEMLADPGYLPFISVTAVTGLSGDYNWKDGFARALTAGNEPLLGKKVAYPLQLDGQSITTTKGLLKDEFRRSFESMVKHRRIRHFFIDEASAIIDATVNRHPVRQFNILKSLAVELGLTVIMVGAYDLLGLKDGNGQLIRRSECLHMRRYRFVEALGADCPDLTDFSLAAQALIKQAPVIHDNALLSDERFVLAKSVGCIGIFRDWLDRACVAALATGDGVLTPEILERTALPISTLLKLTREAEMGEALMQDRPESELAQQLGLTSIRQPVAAEDQAPSKAKRVSGRIGQRGASRDPLASANA